MSAHWNGTDPQDVPSVGALLNPCNPFDSDDYDRAYRRLAGIPEFPDDLDELLVIGSCLDESDGRVLEP